MASKNRNRSRARRKPVNLPRMQGCPGPVCQSVCKDAVHAISHILRTGKPVVYEQGASDAEREVLDRARTLP